jgi:hypothetical protein
MQMKVYELLNRLPTRSTELQVEAKEGDATRLLDAVCLPPDDPSKVFVEPELKKIEVTGQASESPPRVILVQASAAVGKTTLATHLARITRNPYWDLGKFSMGHGFFSGTISSAYGVTHYARVIDEIRSGTLCLILDAVDEAIVASTTTNFKASLENLFEVIHGSKGARACAIFFGRPETIVDTYLYLSDLGIEAEILEVSFFSEQQAKRFVNLQVEKSEKRILQEFDEFVDTFFTRVKEAFDSSDWAVVGSFLGYAPVLDSLALFYLEADNAFRELNTFIADGKRTWSLISDMLNRVLQREMQKFGRNFGGDNDAKRAFAESAFTSKIQVRWLLADRDVQLQAEPDLTLEADPEWLADIEQSLRSQFEDHPFLRSQRGDHTKNVLLGFTSTAFRDYVVANFLLEPDVEYLPVLLAHWRHPGVVPSMMLSKFLRGSVSHVKKKLDPQVLAFLVDSHSKQSSASADLLYLEWTNEADVNGTELESDTIAASFEGDDEGNRPIVISADKGGINLCRSAAHTTIALPNARVVIGGQLSESDLGPRLAIQCASISAQSAEVHINNPEPVMGSSKKRQAGVTIEADAVEGVVRKITGSREEFSLRVPPVPYPWQQFRVSDTRSDEPSEADLLFVGLALRRIAEWFARGKMKFDRTKMDTIVAKGRVSRHMLNFLLARQYIWIDDPFYRMGSDTSIEAIRRLDFADAQYRGLILEAFHALHSEP